MKRFGEFLIEQKVVTDAEIEEALDVQRYRPRKLGRILRDLGALGAVELNDLLSRYLNVTFEGTVEELKSEVLSTTFSEDLRQLCSKFSVIPLVENKTEVKIISTNLDDRTVQAFEDSFAKNILVVIVDQKSFDYIDGHYTPKSADESAGLKAGSGDTGIFRASPYPRALLGFKPIVLPMCPV